MPLKAKRKLINGTDTIQIAGPINSDDGSLRALADKILDEGKNACVLDLSKAAYITSPGLAAIMQVRNKFLSVNGKLDFSGATPDMDYYLSSVISGEMTSAADRTGRPREKPPSPDETKIVAVPVPAATETSPIVEIKELQEQKPSPADAMDAGTLVTVSGEYMCLGCQSSRMWLKGDVAGACENPYCRKTKGGWKMIFELF